MSMKCDVCKVSLNSMVQYNQHMTGQNHAKKVRQQTEAASPPKARGQGQRLKGQSFQGQGRGQGRGQGQGRPIRGAWSGGVAGRAVGRGRGAPGRMVAGGGGGGMGGAFGKPPIPSLLEGAGGWGQDFNPQVMVDALNFAAAAMQSSGMGMGRGQALMGGGGGNVFGGSLVRGAPFMSSPLFDGNDDDDMMDNPMSGSLKFGGFNDNQALGGNSRQAFSGSAFRNNNANNPGFSFNSGYGGGSAFGNNKNDPGFCFNSGNQAYSGGSAFGNNDNSSPGFGFNGGNQAFSGFSSGNLARGGDGGSSNWRPPNRRDRKALLKQMGYMQPQSYLMPPQQGAPQEEYEEEQEEEEVDWNAPVVFGDNMGVVSVNLEDTNKLFCDICCVSMTSQDQAYMHYRGKRHLNKARVARLHQVGALTEDEDNKSANDYYCGHCNITVNTLEQLETHRAGAKHKKMVELRKRKADEATGAEPNGKKAN